MLLNQHSSITVKFAPAAGLAHGISGVAGWVLSCYMQVQPRNPNSSQASPHFVSSRLKFSSSLSVSVVDSAALDSMDSGQPFSTFLLAGGAVISSPSTRAWDSSSSVTAAKAKTKACCNELQQPRKTASVMGQVLLVQSHTARVWSKNHPLYWPFAFILLLQ